MSYSLFVKPEQLEEEQFFIRLFHNGSGRIIIQIVGSSGSTDSGNLMTLNFPPLHCRVIGSVNRYYGALLNHTTRSIRLRRIL